SWPEAAAGATAAEFQPQVVGTNFLGVQASESGFIPPDSMGAVGPDQILVVANGRIKVFDKVGNPGALNASTDVFFQSVLPALSQGTSDPRAVYVFNAAGTAFLGTTGYVVRKSSMLSGGPIVVTAFRQMAPAVGAGPFTPMGVTNDDPLATQGYFIGVDNSAFGLLVLRRVSD